MKVKVLVFYLQQALPNTRVYIAVTKAFRELARNMEPFKEKRKEGRRREGREGEGSKKVF
jgi:ribosome-associated translation inhibitor RaiA